MELRLIPKHVSEILKVNWGIKADCMQCYAEIKYIDSMSHWACYILAINPDNEDEITCILDNDTLELCQWSLNAIGECYNALGEHPYQDLEYRRVWASELFKRLREAR